MKTPCGTQSDGVRNLFVSVVVVTYTVQQMVDINVRSVVIPFPILLIPFFITSIIKFYAKVIHK